MKIIAVFEVIRYLSIDKKDAISQSPQYFLVPVNMMVRPDPAMVLPI